VASKQRRRSTWLLSGGAAVCGVVAAQTGCMPDFDKLSSNWQPASGSGGTGAHAGSGAKEGGRGGTGGANGGTTNGGRSNGGSPNGGGPNGGRGGGARAGTGSGATSPGGEAGAENGGSGAETEGGASGGGGTAGTSGVSGTSALGGEAGAVCDPGYTTCPGSGECATRLDVGDASGATVNNCGTCGVTCSTANATSATCTDGACQATCASNFADCNGTTANDGCEADLTTPVTCGSCTHACSTAGVSIRACTSGACAPTCGASYLDCVADDGSHTDDGCETFVDSLSNCGVTCAAAGVACNPDEVCASGLCGPASGLVQMSIPFTASGQAQRYADVFSQPDLTGSTVTVRMYAPGATNGSVSTFLVDGSSNSVFSPAVTTDFSILSAGWTDIVVPVPAAGGGFETTAVHQVTFDFTATSAAGPWENPTLVYIDRVWSSNGAVNDTFDTTSGSTVASTRVVLTGSSFAWVASVP